MLAPATRAAPAWRAMPATAVLAALGAREDGLDEGEVAARRARHGPNRLPRPPRKRLGRIYLGQFASPLIYLLLAAAAVSLFIGAISDAIFIFAVLQINAAIGTFQEWKAETGMAALEALAPRWAVVRRAAARRRIAAEALVPGDIVLLGPGDRVAADLRLLSAHGLAVDESLLTGESAPVSKAAAASVAEDAGLGDRPTMLHAGTSVLTGRAVGVVVAIGVETAIGHVAQALTRPGAGEPPLLLRMARFSRVIGIVMVALIGLMAVALALRGMPAAEVLLVAVALAVAAIPEGLPVATAVALAVGVNRMARHAVVVRRLPAVEGLGACTLIASDKTGTLTRNELTVRRLLLPGIGEIEIAGGAGMLDGDASRDGEPLAGDALAAARSLALAGVLCNKASLRVVADGVDHFGYTVDVAFLALAHKLGLDPEAARRDHPQVAAIPYESHRRFAAAHRRHGDRIAIYVKGAVEIVAPMCDGRDARAVLAEAERLAAAGHRVIAVAAGTTEAPPPGAEPPPPRGLALLGLVAIIDPPREEVPAAVRACREAGITVCMITGDHPATALAIARDLGIVQRADEVVTGDQLAARAGDRAAFDDLVARRRVFARVEPRQKLDIVEAFQRVGHFVAVTGDGVNDAPALRAANIGVAMGRGGTDIARDAADLVLTDDNFAAVVHGVAEGRIAYDNVRKVILLLLAAGVGEIVLFVLAMAADLPVPLYPVQLIWLNLIANGIQDVTLALEKGEPGVLRRPPRPPDEPIFDARMIEQTLVYGVLIGGAAFLYFAWALESGMSDFAARNGVLLLMVLFENALALIARSERRSILRVALAANPYLVFGVVFTQALHLLAMRVPGIDQVLGVAPVAPRAWVEVALLATSLVVVSEIYKWLRMRYHHADRSDAGGGVANGRP